MGPADDPESPLDPRLRVKGVPGLRVAYPPTRLPLFAHLIE